jgi:Intraflagellar transport 81 calponin homology domain
VRLIVQELNSLSVRKSFNIVDLDSLQPWELLQLLTDVLQFIDPKVSRPIRLPLASFKSRAELAYTRLLVYRPISVGANLALEVQACMRIGYRPVYLHASFCFNPCMNLLLPYSTFNLIEVSSFTGRNIYIYRGQKLH